MNNDQIISRMNTYLHTAAHVLAIWLGKLLPKASDDWWEECVMEKLSYNQRERAKERGFTELEEFDLAALLRIADKSWYTMRSVAFLPTRERECIRDMMRVRNNWAHVGAMLPGKDAVLADLETLRDFFQQRECEDSLVNEVDRMIEAVKSSSTVDFDSFSQKQETETMPEEESVVGKDNEIAEKSLVYLVGNPEIRGIVMSITDLGETRKYDVFVDGNFKTFYSGQIALYVEEATYNWVDIKTFRSYLTAYQINNPSGNNLYSLNAARIDFVPYQFRPALKLIHADEPRILIADSVGVGKTIEAGLIIKELQARNELENIMIICPKPLVTERKWELEMKRFDEDFVPVDGPLLRQIISDTDRDGEWPIRFNKTIVPYSILDSRTYEGESKKKSHTFGLKDLDPAPHFDLVIIDEAHHIRSGSMEKEKAFEYKCVKYFCDNADAVVMLTATPLQTSDNDLFTLLNVLRPDVVIDKQTFNMMSKPNMYISEAVKTIRRAGEDWQKKATEALKGVLETQWGENVIAANPTYGEMVKTLQQDSITREERVKLISDAESLHSFNSMLNRTRRKDIQDFCIRRPYTLVAEFTPRQQELHDALLQFEQNALLQLHGSARSIPFMMTTIKRQAASCIFGLAPHIRDLIKRRFQQLEDDPDMDSEGFAFDRSDADALARMAQDLLI
ncbi:MAG: SNF2-related protein, partial [Clostridiales bacterium]|nr:SNF2-related protein [Clostridiales bacterium]